MEGDADAVHHPPTPWVFPASSPAGPEPSGVLPGYDELAGKAGAPFAQHQRLLCALTCLPVPLATFALLSDLFYTLVPPHHCRPDAPSPGNATGQGSCQLTRDFNGTGRGTVINCPDGWVYEAGEGLHHNIVTQWDLVCDSAWLIPVEEVCLILGCSTGYLVMGYFADRLGRRNTFILSLILSILLGTLVAVSLNPAMFILVRFLQGSSIAGLLLTLYLIRLELCDPPHRLMVTMVAGFFAVGGQFLLLGLAVGCGSWRLLQVVITAPLGLFLVY
ncbi:solute carrier family 22 member 23-like, partial [Scyliorhinus torazame]|uniref:solute carrier family 22 member 23-like n=1 Tax=Scyliorhinus torazame TaxID=75743 RepID=UPI003B5AE98C